MLPFLQTSWSATARDILSRLQLAYENLPKWLQQGVMSWNKGSLDLENGSRIVASSTSSSAVRGGSYNLIFLDEFDQRTAQCRRDFFSSVYPTISSGTTTKVIIVSTPNGMNMFYKLWSDAESERNSYIPIEVHWSERPSTGFLYVMKNGKKNHCKHLTGTIQS